MLINFTTNVYILVFIDHNHIFHSPLIKSILSGDIRVDLPFLIIFIRLSYVKIDCYLVLNANTFVQEHLRI